MTVDGVGKGIPLKKYSCKNSVSYIFRFFYKILFRLWHKAQTLSTILVFLYLKEYFLKKVFAISNQDFLFSPLYLVLKFWIHICSLCFLYKVLFLIFSKTVTLMSDNWWPGRLKCSPVAFVLC